MTSDPPYNPLDEKLISELQNSPNGLARSDIEQRFTVGWDAIIKRLRVLRERGVVDYWARSHVPEGFDLTNAPAVARWVVLKARLPESACQSILSEDDISLTRAEEEMLRLFMAHPDGLSARDLITLQQRDRSTVYKRLRKLYAMGFLTKTEVQIEGGSGVATSRQIFQPIIVE